MPFGIELYENARNDTPVLEFILSLSAKEQAKVYREIELLREFGPDLHFPHVRKFEGKDVDDLWELRIKHSSNSFRIIFFCQAGPKYILLVGFRKKSQKTPKKELATAKQRMADYLSRKL